MLNNKYPKDEFNLNALFVFAVLGFEKASIVGTDVLVLLIVFVGNRVVLVLMGVVVLFPTGLEGLEVPFCEVSHGPSMIPEFLSSDGIAERLFNIAALVNAAKSIIPRILQM